MSYTNTVLITGGTGGLGYHAALNIAKKYPKYLVVITGRSDNHAADKINSKNSQKNAVYLSLDLSTLARVREFAKIWASKSYPPIISLILNAGTQLMGPAETNEEGYEKTFMINHLGHALLFHLLERYLAFDARIIVVSSATHDPEFTKKAGLPAPLWTTPEQMAHPNPDTANPEGMERYNSSKLANVLWAYALARHLTQAGSQITVNAFTPGLMPGTGLARDYTRVQRFLWFHVLPPLIPVLKLAMPYVRAVEGSGVDLMWLALGPDKKGVTGKYFDGRKAEDTSPVSNDEQKQEELWEWTVNTAVPGTANLAGLKK
jgi:NAD(P)-dependent dehydrogenase (short-subunit alcohol dehydrogenase family)